MWQHVLKCVTCQHILNVVMNVSCVRLSRWQILTLTSLFIALFIFSNVMKTKNLRMECKCDKERTKPMVTKNEEVFLRKGKSFPCIGHKVEDLILNKYRYSRNDTFSRVICGTIFLQWIHRQSGGRPESAELLILHSRFKVLYGCNCIVGFMTSTILHLELVFWIQSQQFPFQEWSLERLLEISDIDTGLDTLA